MPPLRDVFRSPVLWIAGSLILGFWIVSYQIDTHLQIEFLRILQTSFAVAFTVAYLGRAIEAVSRCWPSHGQQLAMGIVMGGLYLSMSGTWFLMWRLADNPDWMTTSRTAAFLIWLSILSSALHLTAPGALDGRIPTRNWLVMGASVGMATFIFLIVVYFEPHIGDIINAWEPYFP